MLAINIEKTDQGQFRLTWDDFPGEELNLDFNPLMKSYKLTEGCLVHWQAKPKSTNSTKIKQGRCWGVYDILADDYLSGVARDIPLFKVQRCQFLDVPEWEIKTVPTAVVYFPGLKIRRSINTIYLVK